MVRVRGYSAFTLCGLNSSSVIRRWWCGLLGRALLKLSVNQHDRHARENAVVARCVVVAAGLLRME